MSALVRVRACELKVGMDVVMPVSWDAHPFLKNEFVLVSAGQIEKIIRYGIRDVQVNPGKSLVPVVPSSEIQADVAEDCTGVPIENNQAVVLDALYDVIHDASLQPVEKSRLVRKNSLLMMDNLLQRPTAENIRKSKKAITEIVELILKDDEAAEGLIQITDHDYYTYTHSVNVGLWAVSLAKTLFRDSWAHDLHELGAGFFLHDIGKVRIDSAIINKPERLTHEEMEEMKRHPALGFRILDETRQLTEECRTVVLQHHERPDGAGYPKGLRGDQIHLYAKICSIADVFDALTSNRPYRQGSKPFEALKIMKNQMMGNFQEDLFEKFVVMLS